MVGKLFWRDEPEYAAVCLARADGEGII
jgi:hypothetical protein